LRPAPGTQFDAALDSDINRLGIPPENIERACISSLLDRTRRMAVRLSRQREALHHAPALLLSIPLRLAAAGNPGA